MPTTQANGIQIAYETHGSGSDPTLLLIMGLGGQLIGWDDDFCESLAADGFHVIRYDNRDVGLSTKFDEAGEPDMANILAGAAAPPYTLGDMAADARGLLDALGIERAHVVGASMGGMIAQTLAIAHGERVLSLVSIMSSLGGEDFEAPTGEALTVLTEPPAQTREGRIAQAVRGARVIAGRGFPFDERVQFERATRTHDRMFYPAGTARQMAAILAAPTRRAEFAALTMPVCVIHGSDDVLLPPDNGRRCADAHPRAEFVVIDGMGHDMPRGAWPQLTGAITRTARRATEPVVPG